MLPSHFSLYTQVRPFLIMVCAFLSLLVGGYTIFLYLRADRLLEVRLHEQAAAYYDLIIHTKDWNAGYGGVYVEKKEGVTTNPYLSNSTIEPDLHMSKGREFTLRNHAIMTAEISRMSEKHGGVKFKIISRTPLDPSNTPDSLERTALDKFDSGDLEFERLTTDSPRAYRYIRPLLADSSCLECHRNSAITAGRVLGAVSVILPADTVLAENKITKVLLISWAVAIIGILSASTYFLTWRLLIKLDEVQQTLVSQATTDELTKLMNRRNILKRLDEEMKRAVRLQEHLCIMIIDLDNFKRINDTYGHLFGDVVLKRSAECIKDTVRVYDIVGRIGGEEFLIISPGVEMDVAIGLAERVRKRVSELVFEQGEQKVTVTLSVGATALDASDLGLVSLMKRADRALYQAKEQGRNRVVAL